MVKKSSYYFSLFALYRSLSDKLETISPFLPSTYQFYKWLLEAVDLPEVLVKHPAGLGEDEQALVWQAVQCNSLSVSKRVFSEASCGMSHDRRGCFQVEYSRC